MSSVWYTDVLDSGNWRPSSRRDETTVDVAVPVSSWPFARLDELVTKVDDATVAEDHPPLITPRDIEPDSGMQVPRERAELQPVLELHRQLAVGDILLPPSPRVPAVLVTEAHAQFAFSTAFIPLRVKSEAVDPQYLWMLLSSDRGMRARASVAERIVDWEALKRLRIAVPPLAVQRDQRVSTPGVQWVAVDSRWRLADLRGADTWRLRHPDLGEPDRLRDIARIEHGVVGDGDVFAVASPSRVPVVTEVEGDIGSPTAWASVGADEISRGFDIAVSASYPFRARPIPVGWTAARRFLVVRVQEAEGSDERPTVDDLVAWFNSIGGRSALAAVASGIVLPRLTVSALNRVVAPEWVAKSRRPPEPLAVQLEHALGLL
jgi:hypothetical protein